MVQARTSLGPAVKKVNTLIAVYPARLILLSQFHLNQVFLKILSFLFDLTIEQSLLQS